VDFHLLRSCQLLLAHRESGVVLSLQRQKVVAKDWPVVEDVALHHPMLGVITLSRIFEHDARFQARAIFLADPRKF